MNDNNPHDLDPKTRLNISSGNLQALTELCKVMENSLGEIRKAIDSGDLLQVAQVMGIVMKLPLLTKGLHDYTKVIAHQLNTAVVDYKKSQGIPTCLADVLEGLFGQKPDRPATH